MIRQHSPVTCMNSDRPMPEVPHVDPVEPEARRARGERARRPAARGSRMDFRKPAFAQQPAMGVFPPVVEVACNDECRVGGHVAGDELQEATDLVPAVRLTQRKVQADRVQRLAIARQRDHGVQQAARLRLANGSIHVAPRRDGVPGKKRIAVMPARCDRIAPVGVLGPHAVGQYFVLVHGRLGAAGSPDLLQENEICLRRAQGAADAQQGFVAVPRAESLVCVQREHADPWRYIAGNPGFHSPKLYRGG